MWRASRTARRTAIGAGAAAVGACFAVPGARAFASKCEEKPEEKPISFENMAKEWTQASSLENFDGFRIEATNVATKHLQTSHSLFLGTSMREQQYIYQVGPTFVSDGGKTQIMGRYDLDGSLNGRAVQKLSEDTEVKATVHSTPKDPMRNMLEVGIEQTGFDWAAGAKIGWQGTWLVNGSYTQEITKNLTMGTELMWFAMNSASIGSLAFRYAPGQDIFYGQYTRSPDFQTQFGKNVNQVKLCYTRKVSDRLSLGSEYELTLENLGSSMKAGYEYTFRHARVQGTVDSAGRVACFVTDFMGFGFSGLVDFARGDYKFGFLFHIVPSDEGAPPRE
jgi:mitochondrial import receptor subunit TOM40